MAVKVATDRPDPAKMTHVKVLLTGGTGFVGSWTAKAVEAAGHDVRFLVRTPDKLARAAGALGVDVTDHVVGDITDAESVRVALHGCEAVVHCAALVAIGPGAAERMARTNLDGARNVLGQAVELGLDPAVHVSSLAAVFEPGLRKLTADLPVAKGLDAYGASKAAVENYVRDLQDQGAPIHITYPGMVIGPPAGDQLGEATEGVRAASRLRVIPGRDAAWTVCDVRDLGRVHAALLRPGVAPGRWAAGGIRLGVTDIVRALAAANGHRMVGLPVPDRVLRGFGRVQDRLHLRTPMTGAAMEYYTRMPESDNAALERELGVTFRDPYVTLADAVEGLRDAGLL
jgi:nucleoside-diphosphate-sugar epimerase